MYEKKREEGYNDEDLIQFAKDGWRCHLGDIKPTIQFDGIVRSTTLGKLGRDVKSPLKEAFVILFREQFWNILLDSINKNIEKNKKAGGKGNNNNNNNKKKLSGGTAIGPIELKDIWDFLATRYTLCLYHSSNFTTYSEYSIYFDAQTFMAQDKYLVIEQAFSLSEESIHQLCQEMSINASELVKGFESGLSHNKVKFEWNVVFEEQSVDYRLSSFFDGHHVREKKKVKKCKDDSKQVSLTGTHIRHWFPHLDNNNNNNNNKKKGDNNNNVDDDDKLMKFMENKKMFVISKSTIQNRTTIDYMNDNGLKFIVKSSPQTFPDEYRILVDGVKDGDDGKVSAINLNTKLLVLVDKDTMYITNVYEPSFRRKSLSNPASNPYTTSEIEDFYFESFWNKIHQFDATEKHMNDLNKLLYPLSVADRNAAFVLNLMDSFFGNLYSIVRLLNPTKMYNEFIRDLKSFLFNSSKSDLYPDTPSTPTHTRSKQSKTREKKKLNIADFFATK
ncbi:hypothetical protein DFA_06148 [Cavenderia fasciculata]|uniref:Uncharacterized protein n=1 Tax=Cavenderia fasciculata TaxID=261658 RepID=F4PK86_CACFS|nr:uncharacterized protein DFA_06148 [Cavenderia fasciculata]EGG24010.1 hypothetical protein DFA_06148 [Cavenderia fasciculata]|eukprot:XP_004361861.1 hypothetical protein DFA_06148 [Cavenderia fasciculata]